MVRSSQSYCQNYNFEIPNFLLFLLISDTTMPWVPFCPVYINDTWKVALNRPWPQTFPTWVFAGHLPTQGSQWSVLLVWFYPRWKFNCVSSMPSAHPVKLCVKLFHLYGCEFQTRAAVWWCDVKEDGHEGMRKSRVGNRGMLPSLLRKLIFRLRPGIKIELRFSFLIDSRFLLLSPDILKIIASKGNSFR